MAEGREEDPPPSLPPRGNVQAVRQQWAVHEDGALAYQIQNEEINQHYGINRFNRRTVREDIPVAKIAQSEEEFLQQEKRMSELEVLKAQAEEDELMARRINKQLKREARDNETVEALDDEEIARQLQEKEKKKYERHLEKKREKKLKQERQRLEAELARETAEAGLAATSETGSDNVANSIESLNVQATNAIRVTPAGRFEDGGDFSDFYKLPNEMDEFTRLEIQANQDEELARLLQEQEHKRTKAEVDRSKLKRIEQQDEELAKVMQEQEKIRLRKAKQKHQQKKEALRKKAAELLPLGASANTMNQQVSHSSSLDAGGGEPGSVYQQHSPQNTPSAIPVAGGSGDFGSGSHQQHRYRRNSYTQAFDSPPSPPRSQPPPRPVPNKIRQEPVAISASISSSAHAQPSSSSLPTSSSSSSSRTGLPPGHSSVVGQKNNSAGHHPAANRPPMPISSQSHAVPGMSTLESARRIAAGDHEGILAAQQSSTVSSSRGGGGGVSMRDVDVVRAMGHHTKLSSSHSVGAAGSSVDPLPSDKSRSGVRDSSTGGHLGGTSSQPYYLEQGIMGSPEVRRSAKFQDSLGSSRHAHHPLPQHQPQIRTRSFSYSDEDDEEEEEDLSSASAHMNGSSGFNIATAIDPTYQRRHPDAVIFPSEDTQLKSQIPFARSLPQADGDLEWDPGLRGSLRKTKAPIHGYQDSSAPSTLGMAGGDPSMASWQPVQGQRRDGKSKKAAKKPSGPGGGAPVDPKKDKGSCKQQ